MAAYRPGVALACTLSGGVAGGQPLPRLRNKKNGVACIIEGGGKRRK